MDIAKLEKLKKKAVEELEIMIDNDYEPSALESTVNVIAGLTSILYYESSLALMSSMAQATSNLNKDDIKTALSGLMK